MIGYIVLGIVATSLLLAVAANSRWAATRGWVYNRHNPRPRGAGIPSSVFGQIFQPSVEHVIEEQASEFIRGGQDESGDKPIVG